MYAYWADINFKASTVRVATNRTEAGRQGVQGAGDSDPHKVGR
jgi:hypothetical protein